MEVANKIRIVVVGNGMVGHHFVTQLASEDIEYCYEIIILSAESRLAYDRVRLSEYFLDRSDNRSDLSRNDTSSNDSVDLSIASKEEYERLRITCHMNCRVVKIDRADKRVTIENGEGFAYDYLVLATGSYPFVPPIKGNDQPHCLVYRTMDDLEEILASAERSRIGVVVGGGLLGLEAANALKNLKLQTHVVEFGQFLMPTQLDAQGGVTLRKKIEAMGIHVHTEKSTTAIVEGAQSRYEMLFSDGETLATDMIVFSAGIRPHDELARSFGLELGERGGIAINQFCQTSDHAIYAIGECASWEQQIFGLVAPGYRMAETVAAHLQNKIQPFTGADMSTKLKLLGVDVGSIGDAHGNTPGALSYTYVNQKEQISKKIVVCSQAKKLLGAVLVGDTSEYDQLWQYMINGIDLPEKPEALILPRGGENPLELGPEALPMDATVCSCLNVSKEDICMAVEVGCMSLVEVKQYTKASSGCGGCGPLLKSLVDIELEKQGVELQKGLCPHFVHTRQELYHLARVEEIKTFEDMIDRHGEGFGCDICKPTIASIMASLWNEHILEKQHAPLQDTNDLFLANMQRNGTYSVVPRVPAGEITPEQLIALGQIAKEFRLYTKITGGQRVDLFGARVEQLPSIWRALIEAGFETGHAYGKAVRTVKSCVGSTWCRYGVQDSVGMAIDLENRYKGLRAPHKIKLAVSGCTRECAEAQSKDVGVIATSSGWNLYVCGNGGMKPRHADLLATDLDDESLVSTIDRFLMFYIRTADRLERTSVWRDKLEGGLDYLKAVILEDSLGIANLLEQQMRSIVGSYQCEWKTTLEDEDKMARFKTFVNCDDEDPTLLFIEERGQWRPARNGLFLKSDEERRSEHDENGSPRVAATKIEYVEKGAWRRVCRQKDLIANSGVCALVEGRQVALFYLPNSEKKVYAVGNWDPLGQANVISRGIVGDIDGEMVVASPLYKQRFSLTTGKCLTEKAELPVYETVCEEGEVSIKI